MHFMGQDAISRPTRGSGRTLVSLSFVVWFVKFYGASIENIVISGVSLPDSSNSYVLVQWIVMLPMLIYHLLNWWGDRSAYKGWNVREKVTSVAGFGPDTALVTRLDSILRIVKQNVGNSREIHIVIERLEEIKTEVCRLNKLACLYIWIWVVFPFSCCWIALLWPSSPIASPVPA